MDEDEDYAVFLDSWQPSGQLAHACLPPYLNDPLMEKRLLDDLSGTSEPVRTIYAPDLKPITSSEFAIRGMTFIEKNQARWSNEFNDYVKSNGIPSKKMEKFYKFFRDDWVDGMSRRQKSPMALSIKQSIEDHDLFHYGCSTKEFVINPISTATGSFFSKEEMATIFDANKGLLETYLSDYVDHLGSDLVSTFSDLYVRRGVYMPEIDTFRKELNHLSSYSLALGPVEQFAQTYSNATKGIGTPCIFAAPIPAVQKRTVAFAPFIPKMSIQQFEIIVAPPIEKITLQQLGVHGGIHEFEFR